MASRARDDVFPIPGSAVMNAEQMNENQTTELVGDSQILRASTSYYTAYYSNRVFPILC